MKAAKLPVEFTGVQVDTDMNVLINKLKKKLNVDDEKERKDDKTIHHIDFLSSDAEEKEKVDVGQVMMEAKWDYEYFNKKLTDISKTYNILDMCCENGINTRLVFNNFIKDEINANIKINLISADANKDYIDEYNKKSYKNMHGEVIDFNSDNWKDPLTDVMKKYNVDKFDYIYCPSCLHCFSDCGESFIKKIYPYLRDGGKIYIRTFDDSLQIAYPDEDFNIMNEIVVRYSKCIGINDRSNARKMFKFLRNALYTSIVVEHFCVDTLNKNPKQLEDIYESSFGFRKSVFKGNLERINKDDTSKYSKAEAEYNDTCKLLDKMHEGILDAHYFAYFISVAIAEKPSNSIGFYD